VLEDCLVSIRKQNYPKNKIEIILGDGGSTDNTIELAKKYGAKIVHNPLKTAESGKAIAVKNCTGEYIALIDSDNIIPSEKWLKQMIVALEKEKDAIGGEPWQFTLRKEDGFIDRYCALTGVNDPLVLFIGNHDRYNFLTETWTSVPIDQEDKGDYILAKFSSPRHPAVGANGAIFRANILRDCMQGDYLFDVDIITKHMQEHGEAIFLMVKNDIVHDYCQGNIAKFAKKQRRRVRDYLFHRTENNREYDWGFESMAGDVIFPTLIFILSCVTVFPLFIYSICGYMKKKDSAWFFHPLACEITLWEYGWGVILSLFKKSELSRKDWKQ
jgi:glycosyltransferase involved in cell wall biosynthesis